MLKSQDLLIALHIALAGEQIRYKEIAHSLHISPSTAHRAVGRAKRAKLLNDAGQPLRQNIAEFTIHGARFSFYGQSTGLGRGILTGAAAPVLRDKLTSTKTPLVWPATFGKSRGESLEPLFPTVPEIVADLPKLHVVLAALDLLRVGSARERSVAAETIRNMLL